MDLIEREAAQKAVISMGDAAKKAIPESVPEREWFDIGIATAVTAIENTPDGWISVNERLPDNNQSILVYDEPYRNIFSASYRGNGRFVRVPDWGRCEDVTHWMPLPSPPTE